MFKRKLWKTEELINLHKQIEEPLEELKKLFPNKEECLIYLKGLPLRRSKTKLSKIIDEETRKELVYHDKLSKGIFINYNNKIKKHKIREDPSFLRLTKVLNSCHPIKRNQLMKELNIYYPKQQS